MNNINRRFIIRSQFLNLRTGTKLWRRRTIPTFSLHPYCSIYGATATKCPSAEARKRIIELRQYVWDFKEGNDGAIDRAISEVGQTIKYFFTEEQLKEITFVCLPASKQDVYEKRFRRFSHEICELTGMEDAWGHIRITEDGCSSHEGGGISAVFEVDSTFFEHKYLLLFDDVITTGNTIRQWTQTLRPQFKTTAILGAMSLARTVRTPSDLTDLYQQIRSGTFVSALNKES